MSTRTESGFREGIWEIRDYEIIAHYPEGDWRLTALDVESIRLEPAFDDGVPVCDAFLRARNHPRSDLIGRFPRGEDQICVELALFAARNRIQLIGQPLAATKPPSTSPVGTDAAAPFSRNTPNRTTALPKSPDTAFETQVDPNQPFPPNQGFDPNRPYQPNQGFDPNQPYQPNQGFDPNRPFQSNQNFDPNQPNRGFDPNQPDQGFDPNQPFGPGQGFQPQQGFGTRQGFDPNFSQNLRSPEWWRWTYERTNPAFHRNIVLTVLAAALLMGIGVAVVVGGLRIGSFFSGPGLIILLVILGNRKKGKKRR